VTTRRLNKSDLSVVWNQDFTVDTAALFLNSNSELWVGGISAEDSKLYSSSTGSALSTTLPNANTTAAIYEDSSGNVYVGEDTKLIKYDNTQTKIWEDTTHDQGVRDIYETASSDIMTLGARFSFAGDAYKVVKYSTAGSVLCTSSTLNSLGFSSATRISLDGNITYAAESSTLLYKLASDCTTTWTTSNATSLAVFYDSATSRIWTGSNSTGLVDGLIREFDTSGTLKSSFSHSLGRMPGFARDIIVDSDGNIVVVGRGGARKYTTGGTELASFHHGPVLDTTDNLARIKQLSGGDYIVTGLRVAL